MRAADRFREVDGIGGIGDIGSDDCWSVRICVVCNDDVVGDCVGDGGDSVGIGSHKACGGIDSSNGGEGSIVDIREDCVDDVDGVGDSDSG